MEIRVLIAEALICVAGHCFPALVGDATPSGDFQLNVANVVESRYGGTILMFHEDETGVYAIHRAPTDHRRTLLNTDNRTSITQGCINVSDEVYDYLKDCCSGANIRIEIK